MSERHASSSKQAGSSADALSPASSTSTLRAAPTTGSEQARQRSRGQMARKQSLADGIALGSGLRSANFPPSSPPPAYHPHPYQTAADLRQSSHLRQRPSVSRSRPASGAASEEHADLVTPRGGANSKGSRDVRRKRKRKAHAPQPPLLGGLYFSDLIVVAFFYALNLLRTCGLAELMDVAFKGTAYAVTRLPFEFWQRWSLSRYPPASTAHAQRPSSHGPDGSRYLQAIRHSSRRQSQRQARRHSDGSGHELTQSSTSAATTSDEDEADDAHQLSPFHHLVILLVRFACISFPHLLPRVLFAEETIGPLVRWRTGGGAAGIVREFTNEPADRLAPTSDSAALTDGQQAYGGDRECGKAAPPPSPAPGFRAFWIGPDAHIPVDVRRRDPESRHATTVLYLHGGGFSLGSVAFYAEALIRIMAKVALYERDAGEGGSRCVAVEYDLSPSVRFPAPLLQCLRCYAHLVEVEGIDPASITVAGDSAGANLAMSMLLCLDGQARDEPLMSERDWSKLPMPGKAVFISPWADLRPSGSHAFAHLREQHLRSRPRTAASSSNKGSSTKESASATAKAAPKPSVWTEAMAEYEWDYVAAEALLHFAQVYAGVLDKPRRVRGPTGWVANFCAILAGDPEPPQGVEADKPGARPYAYNPLSVLSRLVTPPTTRLAKAAHTALTEPLLDLGTQRFRAPGRPRADPFQNDRQSQRSGLEPLFPSRERETDAVASTADLFVPTWGFSDSDNEDNEAERDPRRSSPTFAEAVDRLENHILISPALGDWSRIRLERGMLVTWGERERLADDIEAWASKVRQQQGRASPAFGEPTSEDSRSPSLSTSRTAGTAQHGSPTQGGDHAEHVGSLQHRRAVSSSKDRTTMPRQDGPAPTEASYLCTAVEHGPSGVHAWPFVSMYLAGTEAEREKGLDLLASFIARPPWQTSQPDKPRPDAMIDDAAIKQAPLTMSLPARKTSSEFLIPQSPPHHDGLSPVGSLPSDVYDDDERHYMFNSRSREESLDWDSVELRNELGLRGVAVSSSSSSPEGRFPPEPMWNEPTPTTTGGSSPVVDRDRGSAGGAESPRVGLGLAASRLADSQAAADILSGQAAQPASSGPHTAEASDEEGWESDGPAFAAGTKASVTNVSAPAKRAAGKTLSRKRSNSLGKRTKTATSSASSSVMSTPKATSTASFASKAPEAPASLKLDPVHLSAPTFPAASYAAPPSVASSSAFISSPPSRPDMSKMWGGIEVRNVQARRDVLQSTQISGRSVMPQIGEPRRSGMTLAEIEALEEAEEAAASANAGGAAGAGPSPLASDPSNRGRPAGRSSSRDRLSRILGSAYESDPDLPLNDAGGAHDSDSDSESDFASPRIGAVASPRYVDDGTLSSSAQHPLSMDPSFYGLSSYSTSRPEGLSDIAEEDSQFDASSEFGVRSPSGGGGGGESESEDESAPRWDERGFAFTPSGREAERLREALDERERLWRRRRAESDEEDEHDDDDDEHDDDDDEHDDDDDEHDDDDDSDVGGYQEDSDDFSPRDPARPRQPAASKGQDDVGTRSPSAAAAAATAPASTSTSSAAYLYALGVGAGRKSPTPSISSFSSQKSKEDVWW
ncbi:uncharacterized protein PFL1_04697 [Pseudozyma flocculosa PF-1]|uniref:Alpha/beta hydrolase fold-3 domain-containing protein n=1 Tax=Pseudozyma flocculosa PF-1 TaxID=1277687 RepID=A0A061H549_9BASI|nr:uncharacterized protein PFL1_04697 [Pseudozyma flocculosa PF-1]EPQ27559.1 hypothetical protein PFL1_04697 [Pseudozyma flocculosa PF-1]